ncbi:MAG: hypothetical protein SGJ27_00195 [Candidatus Melainabacteria bacterium]|nr:hypothetical protein [Candidatus Melainabacteria bacterium]
MKIQRGSLATSILVAMVAVGVAQSSASAAPFKLGVEERGYIQNPNGGEAAYPMPEMVGQPLQGNAVQHQAPKKKQPAPPKKQPFQGQIQQSQPAQPVQRPMMINSGVQQSIQLPPGFMGAWVVQGLRQEIQAQEQFRAAIPTIFQGQTQDVWTISGNPNSGYAFANEAGVRTAIFVDKVQGDTAFIRYQHPIKNTMAQEAIVMQIAPGGAQFKGLERISIVKQGEPSPRAKVTYQLMGRRR